VVAVVEEPMEQAQMLLGPQVVQVELMATHQLQAL
jgi:hypothetical protein